ncbi:ester cyclase [Flavobacterium sp. UBA6135]|uniref:ester cyclase n=1 Tax=Flavobacterium sp. UBA6135 TaxID=1946553 RepID=UPI0025BCCB98|nr:ester cyclase [Flavobacterium sp. UBA6135]
MKNYNSIIILLLWSSTSLFAQQNTTENNIKMYAKVWDEIVNKRQIDQINATHFDTNITMVASPQNVVGLENFKAHYQNYLTGFSDIHFTIVEIFGQGDKIVKHWQFKGKHTGVFFGVPPTGKAVDVEGVTIAKMKNGKIAYELDFMDSLPFMQQLGLLSDPANVSVIDKLYKAFAKGDIPTVLGGLDTNVVWNEAEGNKYADGNPYKGPDAVLNGVFARIDAEHDSFLLDEITLHEMSYNKVLATLRYKGKYKNGKAYNAQVAHLWTLKDGKVTAFQQYVDTKKLNDALAK